MSNSTASMSSGEKGASVIIIAPVVSLVGNSTRDYSMIAAVV